MCNFVKIFSHFILASSGEKRYYGCDLLILKRGDSYKFTIEKYNTSICDLTPEEIQEQQRQLAHFNQVVYYFCLCSLIAICLILACISIFDRSHKNNPDTSGKSDKTTQTPPSQSSVEASEPLK